MKPPHSIQSPKSGSAEGSVQLLKLNLVEHGQLLSDCCSLLNDEWNTRKHLPASLMAQPGATLWGLLLRESSRLPSPPLTQIQTKQPFSSPHTRHETVIGFAKMTPVSQAACPHAVVANSVIIDPRFRGRGWGHKLMNLLEKECIAQGISYLYLECNPFNRRFYATCGYSETSSVNVDRPVLKSRDVSKLIRFLEQRHRCQSHTSDCQTESISVKQLGSIWMKKRLRSENPFVWDLDQHTHVPWQPQIGPSCGFSVLRMGYAALSIIAGIPRHRVNEHLSESAGALLDYGIRKGLTMDGELMAVDHLVKVGSILPRLSSTVWNVSSASLLQALNAPGIVIAFPYDRDTGTSLPSCLQGAYAHWVLFWSVDINDDHNGGQALLSGRHGASKRLVSAPIKDWIASNAQLIKYKTGLGLDLAGKMVVLSLKP